MLLRSTRRDYQSPPPREGQTISGRVVPVDVSARGMTRCECAIREWIDSLAALNLRGSRVSRPPHRSCDVFVSTGCWASNYYRGRVMPTPTEVRRSWRPVGHLYERSRFANAHIDVAESAAEKAAAIGAVFRGAHQTGAGRTARQSCSPTRQRSGTGECRSGRFCDTARRCSACSEVGFLPDSIRSVMPTCAMDAGHVAHRRMGSCSQQTYLIPLVTSVEPRFADASCARGALRGYRVQVRVPPGAPRVPEYSVVTCLYLWTSPISRRSNTQPERRV